jgi:hypothetical protein
MRGLTKAKGCSVAGVESEVLKRGRGKEKLHKKNGYGAIGGFARAVGHLGV